MPNSVTRKQIRQEVVDRFYSGAQRIRGTAQSSTASTLTDSALAWAMVRENHFVDAWIYVNDSMSKIIAFNPATGTLTFAPDISGLTGAQDYEIHYRFAPDEINSIINRVVTNLADEQFVPVTRIRQGDVDSESGVVGDWFGYGGAPAVTYASVTDELQSFGRQYLNTGALAYGAGQESPRLPVSPQEGIFVCVGLQVILTTAVSDPTINVILHDATNDFGLRTVPVHAELGSSEASPAKNFEVKFWEPVPADCDQVTVRVEGGSIAGSVTAIVQYIIITSDSNERYTAPVYVQNGESILGAYIMDNYPTPQTDVFYAMSRPLSPVQFQIEESGVRSGYPSVVFPGNEPYQYPTWLKIARHAQSLTADTSTTRFDKDLIVNGVLYFLYQRAGDTAGARTARQVFNSLNARRGMDAVRIRTTPLERVYIRDLW